MPKLVLAFVFIDFVLLLHSPMNKPDFNNPQSPHRKPETEIETETETETGYKHTPKFVGND